MHLPPLPLLPPVSPKFRKLFFSCLLLLALASGWFLRGWQEMQVRGHISSPAASSNAPANASQIPLSSQLAASIPHIQLKGHPVSYAHLLQLTAGLHPGRGAPIPQAADVHEMPVIDVSFYNWRGELLSGWLSITTPEAPIIILAHGTPGNRLSMLSRAVFLHNRGYNVLLFDFQSYGRSEGAISTLGMVESEDILAAISYIHGLPGMMYSKIGVLGLSMGATAGVLAAARSKDIVALVAESCPTDATHVSGDVPDDDSREADQELVEAIYGVDITQARPIDVVNRLAGNTAIFFINGDADGVTPLSGMQAMYQKAGNPRQSWIVPGANHAASFDVDSKDYIQKVGTFFDTYLLS